MTLPSRRHIPTACRRPVRWLACACMALACLCGAPARAQLTVDLPGDDAPVDSSYQAYIDAAWDEVRAFRREAAGSNGTAAHNPQPAYAEAFFQYYLAHPHTPTGKQAGESAFRMWENTGMLDAVQEAMEQLTPDAEVWSAVLLSLGNLHSRAARYDEYIALLHRLEIELTDPNGRAMAALRLARYDIERDDPAAAIPRLEHILTLGAHPYYTDHATGLLQEIGTLGIGRPAPAFTAVDLVGNTIDLAALKGRVVLLDFWATWCGPCLPEIPRLKALRAEYPEDDLAIVGVSLDTEEADLVRFLREERMAWPQILEPEGWEGAVPGLYNVHAIPRTYLIGRDGRIAHKDLHGDALREAVAALIGEEGAPR